MTRHPTVLLDSDRQIARQAHDAIEIALVLPWGALKNIGPGTLLPSKLVEQCLGLLQDWGIEALREPAVDRGEEIAGGIALASKPDGSMRGPLFRRSSRSGCR